MCGSTTFVPLANSAVALGALPRSPWFCRWCTRATALEKPRSALSTRRERLRVLESQALWCGSL